MVMYYKQPCDEGVLRAVTAPRGERPHHRLLDHERAMWFGFDPGLRCLTHTISASPRKTLPASTTVLTMAAYAAHRQI